MMDDIDSRQRYWETILELSNKIMELAGQRDWDSLEAVMSARERLMKVYFSAPDIDAGASEAANRITRARIAILQKQIDQIREHDLKVTALIGANRTRLSEELRKLQEARRVVAYVAGKP